MSLERSLLFGAFALQARLVDPVAFGPTLARWADDPRRPTLADRLVRDGLLRPVDRDLIEVLVGRILDDPAQSVSPGPVAVAVAVAVPETVDGPDPGELPTIPHRPPSHESTLTATTEPRPRDDLGGDGRAVPDAGRFQAVRFHARGGLGQVWLAIDPELDREVAVKVLRPEKADQDGWRDRFRVEARITGQLEHPGVVPVHGFGHGGDGRPYYAMRFVRGASLREAIARFHQADAEGGRDPSERELAFRGLLRRFLSVCDVIDYAHSRGILHRDLKPDNILLGPHGETLVADWGLARPWADAGTAEPQGRRASSPAPGDDGPPGGEGPGRPMFVGTPAYMSPEAASGHPEAIGPRSDIYGLGASLYTLLTGHKPVEGDTLPSTISRVRRGDVPEPSRVNPRVHPALAAICRKAMHLDPGHRYPTAAALAADIERWLADEPVSVYRDPAPTRALRWAKRHRSLVASAVALAATSIVSLAIIASVVSYQRQVAESARIRAELAEDEAIAQAGRADRARQVTEGLAVASLGLIDRFVAIADRRLGADVPVAVRQEMIGLGRDFLRGGTVLALPEDRRVREEVAMLARRLANLHRLAGSFDAAEGLYAETAELLVGLVSRFPGEVELADRLTEAQIDWAESRRMGGRPREAAELFRRALADAERRAAADDGREDLARTEQTARHGLAEALAELGRLDEAEEHARLAAERYEPLARSARSGIAPAGVARGDATASNALAYQLVSISMHRGRARTARLDGRPDDAEAHLGRAVLLIDETRALIGDNPVPNLDLFDAHVDRERARLLIEQDGRRAEARPIVDRAVARLDRLLDVRGDVPGYREAMADALALRARLAVLEGRADEAASDAGRSRALLDRLSGDAPRVPGYRSLLGEVLEVLGRAALLQGDREQAAALLREAERAQAEALAINPDHPEYATRLRSHRRAISGAG